MHRAYCSVDERKVNPLFEVFDGGDFALSSWRDVEASQTEVGIYFEDGSRAGEARSALASALEIVGAGDAEITVTEVPDEEIRCAIRRIYRAFFHPRALWNRLLNTRHPLEDARFYGRGLLSLMGHLKDFK